jgi:hypothetical protein
MKQALIVALLLLGGCVHVAPYERGYLARPDMALDASPGTARAMEKIHPSKEAASGGASVGGGGCGCN